MLTSESRTSLSIKNIKVNTLMNVIVLSLQFFSRKIFIEHLGTEVIGLNSTAYNMLEFLNFAELGIVAGVRFMLYKPYYERDYDTINEIITLQGHIYKRISLVILSLAGVLMCLFPWIFAKMELPLWYAYASFGVLLYYYIIGNFVNFRQVMFHVSQHTYRLSYYNVGFGIAKSCFQIATIGWLPYGYLWWLVSELLFTTAIAFIVYRITQRDYPFLAKSSLSFGELLHKHHILVVKVKQLFFHRIGAIVLTKTTPVIIYAIISLTEVTLYGNYKMLVHGVEVLSAISFGSITPGIGNLIAENNREKSIDVFYEIFSVRMLMTAIFAFGIFSMSSPFISLWLGEEYVMDNLTIALITLSLTLGMVRLPFDMYLQASGMFQDIWAPIVETVLNLGCAITGGFLCGLNGILGGSMVGTALVVLLWKPYFLFHNGFHLNTIPIVTHALRLCGVISLCAVAMILLMRRVSINPYSDWLEFLEYAAVGCGGFSLLLSTASYAADGALRRFVGRFATKSRAS